MVDNFFFFFSDKPNWIDPHESSKPRIGDEDPKNHEEKTRNGNEDPKYHDYLRLIDHFQGAKVSTNN